MPFPRGDLLDHLACLLGPVRLAEQSDEGVESVAAAVLCAVVEHGFHTAVAKRSVEPPTCMDVRAGEVRELCEPFRVGEQGHVPQMVAVGSGRWNSTRRGRSPGRCWCPSHRTALLPVPARTMSPVEYRPALLSGKGRADSTALR